MTFIVFLLKFIHLAIALVCGYSFRVVYLEYKKLKQAPDWEETTIFGRLVISFVLLTTLISIAVLGLFLLFFIGSNVTISSYF